MDLASTPTIATATTSAARRRAALAGPIACGCALLGAATYVAAIDPYAPGSGLPSCPLHELTGWWCPGCGLTRATHSLLRADLGAAFGANVLFPVFLGAIVLGWVAWMRSALGRSPIRWFTGLQPWMLGAGAAVLVVFTVLRNLAPFAALAP